MAVNVVPTSPEEQVLLIIGDEDEQLISIAVIAYILSQNEDDVNLAALEAVKYIIASLTARVDQEVGDVKVKFSQLLDNYKGLLDDLISDPAFQLTPALHIIGGTEKDKARTVKRWSNSRGAPLDEGDFTNVPNCRLSYRTFYDLDCD